MGICKVLHLIDSAGMYGAERVILTLLDELKESPFPGIVGCIRDNNSGVPQIIEEAQKKRIETKLFTIRRGFNPKGIAQILHYVKRNSIRIVHSHGYKPNIFLSVVPHNGMTVLSTVHGWSKQNATMRGKIYEFFDSLSLRMMHKVIAVSKAVSKDLVGRGLKKEMIEIIYNGIKIDQTDSVASRETGTQQNKLTFGAVGRLTKVKGYQYLIEAMASVVAAIPDSRLIIAGDGPVKNELLQKISRLGLNSNIVLVGYQTSIQQFLSGIDLFIMPSLSEGLPMALLEAMAYGKPVLASSVGGIPEVITDGESGVLVPPADSNALSRGILKLCMDQDFRTGMSQRAKELVGKTFSSGNMAEQYAALYSRFIQ